MQQLSVTKCEFEIDESQSGEHSILKVQEVDNDYTEGGYTINNNSNIVQDQQKKNDLREKSTLMAKIGQKVTATN